MASAQECTIHADGGAAARWRMPIQGLFKLRRQWHTHRLCRRAVRHQHDPQPELPAARRLFSLIGQLRDSLPRRLGLTGRQLVERWVRVRFLGVDKGKCKAEARYTLKALNGAASSEFRGYESWQNVAVSATDDGIKTILANPVMVKAYKDGIPGNGKPFPDGSVVVKIEWSKKKNLASPYSVEVPDSLKSVSFIEKNAGRFPDSNGWGYSRKEWVCRWAAREWRNDEIQTNAVG